jgi:YhcN/YlaJ family sporulation lipoprotein
LFLIESDRLKKRKGGENVSNKTFVALFAAIAILTSVALGGCQPARKPLPSQPPPSPQSPSTQPQLQTPARQPAPPKTYSGQQKSADDAARAAVKVAGVKSATAVVSGNTAYIGLELQPNMEKKTDLIAREVAKRVRAANTGLKQVYVASDPDLVERIKKIADGIKKGQPVSSFASEMSEIARRIRPQA